MVRDKFNISWGDTGIEPTDGEDFESGERPDAQIFDWKWYNTINKINKIWDELTRIDSNDDGIVDEADDADTVDGFHAEELGLDIEEAGSIVVANSTGINFTGHLDAVDDGDGTVTIDPTHDHSSLYNSGKVLSTDTSGNVSIGGEITENASL